MMLMKVVFVLDSLKHGGAERVVSELSNYFVSSKVDVSIILLSKIDTPFYKLDKRITLLSSYSTSKSRQRKIKCLRKCIINENPSVVVSFLSHVCIYTYLALKKHHIPLIVSERNDPSKMSFLLRLLSKHVFKKASGNVYQTNDAMKWYKNHTSKDSIVIPNPIVAPKQNELAKSNKTKTIVFTGRLQKQKNVEFLIESFSLFLKKHQDYVLKIYGDGPLNEPLKKYCESLEISSSILFCGPDHNWLANNLDASLFFMTSLYEGMPNALLEAASRGLNCLSSDCPIGGPRELSFLYSNITLFKKFDAADVSNKIEKSMAVKVEMKDVQKANEYLSIDNIGNLWLNFIRKIADDEQ